MFAPAPDFPADGVWCHSEGPIRIADLRGYVVVIDFWTYCCINCLQTLPVLQRLAEKFADRPVVVLGVHCAKFPSESDPRQRWQAIRRCGVHHPVLADPDRVVAARYGVEVCPTIAIVDPIGGFVGQGSGEPDLEALEEIVLGLLEEHRSSLASKPFGSRKVQPSSGRLSFPGKVIAADERLFVADTGNHQIVELVRENRTWREQRRFGRGDAGFQDGSSESASFDRPNGLALDEAGEQLFIADTANHALRVVSLATGRVRTISGTGERGRQEPSGRVPAAGFALRSPWDLAWDPARRQLYVAMAGIHQLWAFDERSATLCIAAGDGLERRRDGRAGEASFAQPSGLALMHDRLYVADTQISCVREVALDSFEVRTVCGGDLFSFGDRDGRGDEVRLQHPVGIAAGDDRLLLADSYNRKIKLVDARNGRCTTQWGSDAPGFDEPEGLCFHRGSVIIADTGNHRVVEVDLTTGTINSTYA